MENELEYAFDKKTGNIDLNIIEADYRFHGYRQLLSISQSHKAQGMEGFLPFYYSSLARYLLKQDDNLRKADNKDKKIIREFVKVKRLKKEQLREDYGFFIFHLLALALWYDIKIKNKYKPDISLGTVLDYKFSPEDSKEISYEEEKIFK